VIGVVIHHGGRYQRAEDVAERVEQVKKDPVVGRLGDGEVKFPSRPAVAFRLGLICSALS